jgi:hypothetical protein
MYTFVFLSELHVPPACLHNLKHLKPKMHIQGKGKVIPVLN